MWFLDLGFYTLFGVLVVDENLNIVAAKKAQYLREKGNIFKIDEDNYFTRGNFIMDNLAYRLIKTMSCELAKNWLLNVGSCYCYTIE